jgi:hypothetical protein
MAGGQPPVSHLSIVLLTVGLLLLAVRVRSRRTSTSNDEPHRARSDAGPASTPAPSAPTCGPATAAGPADAARTPAQTCQHQHHDSHTLMRPPLCNGGSPPALPAGASTDAIGAQQGRRLELLVHNISHKVNMRTKLPRAGTQIRVCFVHAV